MAKPYDATMKSLLEIDPGAWLRLFELPESSVSLIDADVSTVIAVNAPRPMILHFEFQASPSLHFPRR